MSKIGFYSEKLVSFIFIIYSKTENILSLELQCMKIYYLNLMFFLCFSELKKMKSNMFSLFTLFKKG